MYALVLAALVSATSAASVPACPNVKTADNFDIHTFANGKMYEIGRYIEDKVEKKRDCAYAIYKLDGDVAKFDIYDVEDKHTFDVDGQVEFKKGTAKLVYSFMENGKLGFDVPLDVVATDNANYYLLYNCNYDAKTNQKSELFWILTRASKLEGDVKTAVDNFIKSSGYIDVNKISWDHFDDAACEGQ